MLLVTRSGGKTMRIERPIEIIASDVRSTRRLGGAWVDLYHHSEDEGKPFNAELGKMTDPQWRELVRAMHAVDQNILVITMMFQNFTHRGRHKIETEGYQGKAYYPSKLFPGRMPIASQDPLEAILSEADRLGMHVMPGVGCYAFFDYTPGSLALAQASGGRTVGALRTPSLVLRLVRQRGEGRRAGQRRGATRDRGILPRVHALRAATGAG